MTTTIEGAELLPCPLCQSIDISDPVAEQIEHNSWTGNICCNTCNTDFTTTYTEGSEVAAKAQIVKQWQTRTSSPEAVGEAVAWMYHREGRQLGVRLERVKNLAPKWTEIPLYRHPVAADREALSAIETIIDKVIRSRKGTDDWFDLVEIEALCKQALAALSPKGAGE